MNSLKIMVVLMISASLLGCSYHSEKRAQVEPALRQINQSYGDVKMEKASLKDHEETAHENSIDRKIISNAELSLEVAKPLETQQAIGSIAASLSGFVVTSESKQSETANMDPSKQQLTVSLVIRVPAAQFDSAVSQIVATAGRVIHRKVTGQDVTEEFIDLEARIKAQKALELQFLEIMKQATKVADAMEVQRQIAEVRSEIEKLEGRKRFLENRASLSTITVNLQTPTAVVVNTSSFGRSVREAVASSVDLATEIVLGVIRFVILLIPILVFFILPAALTVRYLVRRSKRLNLATGLKSADS